MNNPVLALARSVRAWRALQRYPGVFSVRDAARGLRYVLQPRRVTDWELRRFIERELEVKATGQAAKQVRVRVNGLMFYWQGALGSGLGEGVLQEMDGAHPHYYTTPPVRLTPESKILDVGACEGLFAMRILAGGQARRVICFEPCARTADYLCRAAKANGVIEGMQVEVCAAGSSSAKVFFTDLADPEGNRVVTESGPGLREVRQVRLDDYCAEQGIKLNQNDLIKIDAEGADVEVIRGAERLIREGSPQIAVTTYHDPGHAADLIELLRCFQPKYQLRLKGFTIWGTGQIPRPVLLQAALARA